MLAMNHLPDSQSMQNLVVVRLSFCGGELIGCLTVSAVAPVSARPSVMLQFTVTVRVAHIRIVRSNPKNALNMPFVSRGGTL